MSQFAKKSVLKTFTLPLMIASITVIEWLRDYYETGSTLSL